jgi:tetratricopeptide (TPR) repeat protein
MKLKLYTLSLVAVTVLLFSCKSAKKMYEKGNYDEAVELAAKKLQKKPNDATTLDILQNAYRFAVDDHESRIRNNAASNNDLRSEWTYNEYLSLQRLYEAIRRSPAVFDIVRPTDYSSYIATYKEEASDVRYDRGLALMETNTKPNFKLAYFEFQQSLALKPGDLAAKQKMDEAYAGAVTNVIVLPVVQPGFHYSSYDQGLANFDYNMLRYLNNSTGNIFVRYYAPAEANSLNIRTDQIVEMRFSGLDIDRYQDNKTVRQVSKEVVVKETVIKPDSIVKEYATVRAKITTTRRTMQADGLLQVTVRDHNSQWLWSTTYTGGYNWSAEFSTYNGDSRALTEEDKKLINRKEDFPPSNDEIAGIIINEIRSKTECGVKDYFNRY